MAKIVKSEVHQIRLARSLPGTLAFGNVDGPRTFNSTFESPGCRVATDWEDPAVVTTCPGGFLLLFEHFDGTGRQGNISGTPILGVRQMCNPPAQVDMFPS